MFKKFLSKYDKDLKKIFNFNDNFYKDIIKEKLFKNDKYII